MKTLNYLFCCALLCLIPAVSGAYMPATDKDGNPITTTQDDDTCER